MWCPVTLYSGATVINYSMLSCLHSLSIASAFLCQFELDTSSHWVKVKSGPLEIDSILAVWFLLLFSSHDY